MARTPSRPRSSPKTEFWLLPLREGVLRARVSQPKRAKWKMVVRREGVMLAERGIQLKRWARHSRAREQTYSLSVSRTGIGWFNSLAVLGLCNRVLRRSPGQGKKDKHLPQSTLAEFCLPGCKIRAFFGQRASITQGMQNWGRV